MKKKAPAKAASASKTAAELVIAQNVLGSTELTSTPAEKPRFAIVGIGASAGGLEAIGQLLSSVPTNSGMAFVVVQHLDPTLTGMLPELLQRTTSMQVVQVKDATQVLANCVYVIPPNADMSILNGVLHLLEPTAPRGLRFPIDFFLRALAEDQQERSVAVILSGMGTDGTIGLRAIKEHGGLTLVQDPTSAKFDGMPRSAIHAGLSDITVSATEIPKKILEFLNHVPSLSVKTELTKPEEPIAKSQIEKVIVLLRSHTGHDFSHYKRSTIDRRVERRMGLHKLSQIQDYVRYLRENPQEIDLLFKELLIGVTSFFRDPAVWDQLQHEALPKLFSHRQPGTVLRAWVAGCSTGEEAYSLAILLRETMESLKLTGDKMVQIFATDLDAETVSKARLGFFPANIAADVSPERLKRFFVEEPNGYRVTKEIREMVIFASQNLIMDPPFTNLDVLSCRNLLIYLDAELQRKLIPLFAYSLKPGGLLMLGNAESIAGFTYEFQPMNGKSRIFLRQKSVGRKAVLDFPAIRVSDPMDKQIEAKAAMVPPDSLQSQAERWLLKRHAPSAALVNDQGDILFTSGRTGRYLEPAAGKANWNIFVMARGGLAYELTSAFHQARQQKDPVVVRSVKTADDTEGSLVELAVQFISEPGVLEGLAMIVFSEVASQVHAPKSRAGKTTISNDKIQELELQLVRSREELHRTRDDMLTSQEELKSLNEEHQSTNEELQSTNEELTTSKEEMQSLNEELQTVNAELQAKLDELSATSNDMKNLLNSTEIATVFLDNSLKVRRFTEHVNQIIKLIPGDIGRPVTDLAIGLLYPDLANDAREVLRTLIPLDKSLVSQDGRWFATRLMPYRTFDNRISGIVITFTDMTVVKKLEAELHASKGKVI